MLGRQSSILVTNDDLVTLEALLRRRGDVQFLSSEPNEARNSLLPLKTLVIDRPGETPLICYLAPDGRHLDLDVQQVSDMKVHMRSENSEVIEFSRSYHPGEVIRAGRVYYTPRHNDPDLSEKDPEFVRWAERVVSAIRKSLSYDKSLLAYVGEDAARKIAAGELKAIA